MSENRQYLDELGLIVVDVNVMLSRPNITSSASNCAYVSLVGNVAWFSGDPQW